MFWLAPFTILRQGQNRSLLRYSGTQIGCRSNIGHQPVMRPNISGAAPNHRWRHLPRHPPATLQRTPPRPGHTANAIFKMIQGWTFDGSWRKIVPGQSDSVREKVSTRSMTSFTRKNTWMTPSAWSRAYFTIVTLSITLSLWRYKGPQQLFLS